MTLQNSGSISIGEIAEEMGGTTPHSLSEYYGFGSGVPSSGAISISEFYGASAPEYFQATGGNSNFTSGNNRIHVFNGSGTLTVTQLGNSSGNQSVEYLILGGGGGGGRGDNGYGGGGGSGAARTSYGTQGGGHSAASNMTFSTTGGKYVTIGSGGSSNSPGGHSHFNGIFADGGGFGGNKDQRGGIGNSRYTDSLQRNGGGGGGGGSQELT